MKTFLTRRQTETAIAAVLAAVAGIIGLSSREEGRLGPKFLALQKIGNFRRPVDVAQPPRSDLLFVVESAGRVRVVTPRGVVKRPFLDITDLVGDRGRGYARGMLAIAFPPDYTQSGRFYVSYNDRSDDLRVVQYRRSARSDLLADPGSARDLLTIAEPTPANHGGGLAFGPDGYLYIGSGDGGPPGDPNGVAQDPTVLQGKLLRIDPNPPGVPRPGEPTAYTIPPDNPFVGEPGRDEIYALGLRDPWRFSFDRATGALAIGDIGNDRFEEVDYVGAGQGRGANFGWSAYEGFAPFRGGVPRSQTTKPVLAYPHGRGCAVIGGFVVRDPHLTRIAGRQIVGWYLFGDHCSGRLFAFRPGPKRAGKERKLRFRIPALTSLGEDSSGRIYVASRKGGVWRLVARRKRK